MWNIAWIFILEAVIITAANATTIVIFYRTHRLHSKQYIMIINQAVADLLIGLLSVPMFTVRLTKAVWQVHDYSSFFRHVFYIQDSFLGTASLFGLVLLSVERAHATYFPFRHSTLGKVPYITGIVFMWVSPFILTSQYIFLVEENIAKNVVIAIIGFILVTITVAYSLIVLKVRCTTTQSQDLTTQENKKLTVTLAVVTFLSLIMWLPFTCLVIGDFIGFPSYPYFCVKFLQYGNSLVNSVVYAFRMRRVKNQLLRAFPCCRNNQVSVISKSEQRTYDGVRSTRGPHQ